MCRTRCHTRFTFGPPKRKPGLSAADKTQPSHRTPCFPTLPTTCRGTRGLSPRTLPAPHRRAAAVLWPRPSETAQPIIQLRRTRQRSRPPVATYPPGPRWPRPTTPSRRTARGGTHGGIPWPTEDCPPQQARHVECPSQRLANPRGHQPSRNSPRAERLTITRSSGRKPTCSGTKPEHRKRKRRKGALCCAPSPQALRGASGPRLP